jgi:hypothetical protein
MTKAQAGQLGGLSTLKKHGAKHMSAIGKRGAKVTWTLYKKVPYGQTEYAMIRLSDNKIIAITGA